MLLLVIVQPAMPDDPKNPNPGEICELGACPRIGGLLQKGSLD